jgi:hypothetical protein
MKQLWIIIFLLLYLQKEALPQEDISVNLEMGPRYFYREGAINMISSAISAQAFDERSDDLLTGRITLGFKGTFPEGRFLVEFETPSISGGKNIPFAQERPSLSEGYIDFSPSKGFLIRIGIFDIRHQLRLPGEPFFLDIAESESFFGLNELLSANLQLVERELLSPSGIRIRLDRYFYSCEIFGAVLGERGFFANDENILGGIFEARPLVEKLYLFGIAALSSGQAKGSTIWTMGCGCNYYPNGRFELFGEFYLQKGRLIRGIDKDAWGAHVGTRLWGKSLWIEFSFSYLSGDKTPFDRKDSSFQSYEGVDRFAILEENEMGLDIDTNYIAYKLSSGWKKKKIRLRVDIGIFRMNNPIYRPDAQILVANKALGKEIDLRCKWSYSKELSFEILGAVLFDSRLLKSICGNHKKSTWIFSLGASLRF